MLKQILAATAIITLAAAAHAATIAATPIAAGHTGTATPDVLGAIEGPAMAPLASELAPVDMALITSDDLIDATVYSQANENLGEVGDVVLAEDGRIDALVLDVGGFLGLGEKPVAIAFDKLDVRKDKDGLLYVYTTFTKEQLEAAPDYNKDRYQGERSTMRLGT